MAPQLERILIRIYERQRAAVEAEDIRRVKAEADRRIWAQVPPLVITREEAGHARMSTPRRVVVR